MRLLSLLGFLSLGVHVHADSLRGHHHHYRYHPHRVRRLDVSKCRQVGDYYENSGCNDNAYDCARRKVDWDKLMNDSIKNPARFREIVSYLEENDIRDSDITCWENVVLNANGGWQSVREYLVDLNIDLVDMIDYLAEEDHDYGWLEEWIASNPGDFPDNWNGDDGPDTDRRFDNEADRISQMTKGLTNYDPMPNPNEKLKISSPHLLIDKVYDCNVDENSCTGSHVVSGNDPNNSGGFKEGYTTCGVLTETAGQLAAYEYTLYLERYYETEITNMCYYVHESVDTECFCELDPGDVMYMTATYDGWHKHNDGWGTFDYVVDGYVNGKLCIESNKLTIVLKDFDGLYGRFDDEVSSSAPVPRGDI
mmetsp:Transcript_15198/g.32287  ORF Transcript_15198/g.32287 Transcript_15198/m.32287 type:complete len:365 (+) Transcript_15198:51-1145(+)